MNESVLLYLYRDNARMLCDFEVDPTPGALGSNWSVSEYPTVGAACAVGEAYIAAMQAQGWAFGRMWAPTF